MAERRQANKEPEEVNGKNLTLIRNVISILAIVFAVGMMYNNLESHTKNEDIHLSKHEVVFTEKEKIDLMVAIKSLTKEVAQLSTEVKELRSRLK